MKAFRSTLIGCTLLGLVLTWAAPAQAATVKAADGDSSVSITTPIKAPADSKCSRITYAFNLAADVDYATTVILDANSAMVARSEELIPGTGTGKLAVCGATLHGKASPFTLQLLITYSEDSAKGAKTAISQPFTFLSKPITCKKAQKPGKGTVKKYTTGACPKGWTLVS